MRYYFSKIVDRPFVEAVEHAVAGLKAQGFGVLMDLDVPQIMQAKLGVDFRPYRILGACNPPMAHRALLAEDKIGLMLPCNVIVQQTPAGEVEVAAIDPAAAMQGIDNPELAAVAAEVGARLQAFVEGL